MKAAICVSLLLLGCGYTSPYMRPALEAPAARPGTGTIVFVRPSSLPTGLGATILDGDGRFVGDAAPASRFQVTATPGRHVYLVWAENTDAIEIYVAPGRIYYVEVATSMGAWSARFHLLALAPGRPHWDELTSWLRRTTPLTPDFALGQEYLARRARDVQERVARGREHLEEYRAQRDARHFIVAGEGIAATSM